MKTVPFNDCYLNKMGKESGYMVLRGRCKEWKCLRGCEAAGQGEFGLTGLSTKLFYCIIYHVIIECPIFSKTMVLN